MGNIFCLRKHLDGTSTQQQAIHNRSFTELPNVDFNLAKL